MQIHRSFGLSRMAVAEQVEWSESSLVVICWGEVELKVWLKHECESQRGGGWEISECSHELGTVLVSTGTPLYGPGQGRAQPAFGQGRPTPIQDKADQHQFSTSRS